MTEPVSTTGAAPEAPAEELLERARTGDASALEAVLAAVQHQVYGLALRALGDPGDAEDASQEILVRISRGLAGYRGEAAFPTWVYRVATNHLLNARRSRAEQQRLTFASLDQLLEQGLAFPAASEPDGEGSLLQEEVKIGCTESMLLCLDRAHRIAFILSDVLELSGSEGAAVLEISDAAYRKRVSRARERLRDFMTRRCGLVEPENECRCARQVPFAVSAGIIDPERLRFATHEVRGRLDSRAAVATREIAGLESVVEVFRGHPAYAAPGRLVNSVREIVQSGAIRAFRP